MRQALTTVSDSENIRHTAVTGNCAVCKLTRINPEVDRIVHKQKFDEQLMVKDVIDILEEKGISDIKYQVLGKHYRNHLPPNLSMEYRKQSYANRIRNKGPVDCADTRKLSMEFDALVQLKELFADLSAKMSKFEREHGSELKVSHLPVMSSITGELRRIANDISKITTDREYVKEIVVKVYYDNFKSISVDVGNLFKEVILSSIDNPGKREEMLFLIKERLGRSFEKNFKKFDEELGKKL